MFPKEIKEIIKNLKMTEIVDFHTSGDKVYNINNTYILKVSSIVDRLEKEYLKDCWLINYIACGKPVKFIVFNNKGYYLKEYIDGVNLCSEEYINNPSLLIKLLVEAINILHSTKVDNRKYVIDAGFETLIHGDFCLPNILVRGENVVGFVDLLDAGIGDPWRDYAWCIWSLEYNLKTSNYTNILLEKLNIEFDIMKYNQYINE